MSLEKITVQIVDDHPLFRRGVRDVIEREPRFSVAGESGDGEAALADVAKLKPAIVLLDLNIPKLSGLQLVRALRDLRPAPAIIVLTMQSEESTFNAAMDAGAQGYILKENAAEDLVLGLKTVAGGGVYLSPSIAGYLLKRTRRASALREEKTGLTSLTPTERQVLRLVAENKTNKEIGAELCMSHRTVETHRANICKKLEMQGPRALLQFALEHRSEL
jgi:DNA-binding NarL/FixJ family response regulator